MINNRNFSLSSKTAAGEIRPHRIDIFDGLLLPSWPWSTKKRPLWVKTGALGKQKNQSNDCDDDVVSTTTGKQEGPCDKAFKAHHGYYY